MASRRTTPDIYDNSVMLVVDTQGRTYNGKAIPYGKIVVQSKKGDVNFKLCVKKVEVSNWFGEGGKRDDGKDNDKRTVILKWTKNNPHRKSMLTFAQQFVADIQKQIDDSAMFRKQLGIPDGHKIPPLLQYDTEKDEYWCYSVIRLNNMIDRKTQEEMDYGRFKIKDLDGEIASIDFLRSHGFEGSITDMQFELKGKKEKGGSSTMHIEVKVFEGVAGKFIKNDFGSNDDVRQEMLEEYTAEDIAELRRIKAAAKINASSSSHQKDPRINIIDSDGEVEDSAPLAIEAPKKKPSVENDSDNASVSTKGKKKKNFSPKDALAGDDM